MVKDAKVLGFIDCIKRNRIILCWEERKWWVIRVVRHKGCRCNGSLSCASLMDESLVDV